MLTTMWNLAMDAIQLGADILCAALDMVSDLCAVANKTAIILLERAQTASADLKTVVDSALDVVEFVLETIVNLSATVLTRLVEIWEVFLKNVPEVVIELARAIAPIMIRFAASALV